MTEPTEPTTEGLDDAWTRLRARLREQLLRLADELTEPGGAVPLDRLAMFMDDKAAVLLGPGAGMLIPLPWAEVNRLAERHVSEMLDPPTWGGMYL